MMDRFLWGLADLVAAVWIWALLTLAATATGLGLYVWGWHQGRHQRDRAVVLAAWEQAAASTVVIPRPREQVKR